jgi:hypothetical protein
MTVERYIRLMAGAFVLISLALGVEASPLFHSTWWLALTAFVGLNLFQSGITNVCPPSFLLKRMGVPDNGPTCSR